MAPTPGKSTTVSIPSGPRMAGSPTPDSSSSWGDWMLPAERMTSPEAEAVKVCPPPPTTNETPVAVWVALAEALADWSAHTMPVAWAEVRMTRFGREAAMGVTAGQKKKRSILAHAL